MFSIAGFEWDKTKAEINEKKHGVTFNEAVSVFYDDDALLIPDPEHSYFEERFVLLGISEKSNVLVVVHCERDENIRIISARKATKREESQYRGKR
ncbi:BrnT family toxin [Avibacterium gallinarum]|uniref:BrnT family toxin n=1 Tax=Avibacterium gallinarum TaxID=755 RepID=UPI003BF922BF